MSLMLSSIFKMINLKLIISFFDQMNIRTYNHDLVMNENLFGGFYPRREGKTKMTVEFAVMYLLTNQTDVKNYSQTKSQSDHWMDEFISKLNLYKNHHVYGWIEFDKKEKEIYSIKSKKTGTVMTVYSVYSCYSVK